MATKDSVDLSPPHPPKEESLKVFAEILPELKAELRTLRHKHDKHEKEYFQAVSDLSDDQLTAFSPDDFTAVRVAGTAYGIILFGKLRIAAMPASGPAFVHFRAYSAGPDEAAKFHSFYTEEKDETGGGKTFRAIFTEEDPLEWFDS